MRNRLCAFALPLTFGCTGVSSLQTHTGDVHANLSARSSGLGATTVKAILTSDVVDGLQYISLDDGDSIWASNGNRNLMMAPEIALGVTVQYAVDFPVGGDATFNIDLRRRARGAPHSSATLPTSFTLDPHPDTAKRSEPLMLSWSSAATDAMKWSATGPCIQSPEFDIMDDPGHVVIPANAIKGAGSNPLDSCQISITVTRFRKGTIDPNYAHDSKIVAAQERTISLMSTP